MVKDAGTIVGSGTDNLRALYRLGIGANLVFAVGHIAYAFMEYDTMNEPALWFVSGALAIIFNASLNALCLKETTRLSQTLAVISNLMLLVFSVVLAIVVPEVQTICFALVVLFTFVICYRYNGQRK